MSRKPLLPVIAALAALFSGCVATQKVPVSTDPGGAVVFLDGAQVCAATPCSVDIPKDQNHLLTILKPGFRQKDVPVRRVFDSAGVLRESVREGVRTGDLEGAVASADAQEREGRAYKLSPDMVVLRLVPEGQPDPTQDPQAQDPQVRTGRPAEGELDPVELGLELYRLLEKQNAQ